MLDSSVLIAAERKGLTAPRIIRLFREVVGEVSVVICALTIAELGHGIYRADTPARARLRRQFLDEVKTHIPISFHHGIHGTRIGGEQAAKGVTLPLGDLIIGACALELGYSIGTHNVRDFNRIPGLKVIGL